jgi:hypothetical protein
MSTECGQNVGTGAVTDTSCAVNWSWTPSPSPDTATAAETPHRANRCNPTSMRRSAAQIEARGRAAVAEGKRPRASADGGAVGRAHVTMAMTRSRQGTVENRAWVPTGVTPACGQLQAATRRPGPFRYKAWYKLPGRRGSQAGFGALGLYRQYKKTSAQRGHRGPGTVCVW